MKPKLSLVIPVYNEEPNLKKLFDQIASSVNLSNTEIIFIDDKSLDNSLKILKELASSHQQIKLIAFRRNFGQTAAIAAGINNSSGEVIVTLDADLQNDPSDIKKLLGRIDEGYDVVSGWRKKRNDSLFTKKIPSAIANRLISLVTGVKLHDYGCTLKAYKSEVIKNVNLFGEMHRFIPAYTALYGAKIAEIPVNHNPRKYGKSNYGLSRTFKVFLDLITIKFTSDYYTKPIYVFGGLGLLILIGSFFSAIATIGMKFYLNVPLIDNPLLLLSVLLIILAAQFILMGLLADINIRTFHEASGKPFYLIKEKINF